jgi:ABC-type transport system involved in cytochrome c biogenesis permease subunit
MKPARSHYVPRTSAGRLAVCAFLALFAFTQPPLVFWLANRVEPWVGGVPFLYAYLFILYVALITVLLWAKRKDL